ncbi:MAG: FtsW/RodA/SpoVE family cell cycle protein [Lachnospiraceae bacterium]|nr:FtsW/RodA/SpoVE family cell cycle protein [Lachnospiraceae bacterium]MBR5738714.1 FtsW/RodA/SpoVE family cell cycle protein [Lachnospiraceae bacterium]
MNIRYMNFRLILYTAVLSVIGILVVNSATANETTTSLVSTTVKQIIGVAGGLIVMGVLAFIDYHKLVKFSWIFYILAIGSLLYLLLFTTGFSGAKRWIHVPALGTIQPSEFAKPAMMIFLAFVIYKLDVKLNKVWGLLLYFVFAAPILILVLREPDLSTSIVIAVMIFTILFLGGVDYRWILGLLAVLVPVVVVFLIAVYQPEQTILHSLFKDHQVERINGFFFPENYPNIVYQQNNSVMAIGSGGLFGKGLNNSSLESVKNGSFLSEEQCDFIFAIVGEELGFFGCIGVLILLALTSFECFRIASACTDTVGKVIAGTVGTTIAVQSFINIGVATLVLPNTGIPLPFVSAGLSSLLGTFIMVGLVLSVGMFGRLKRRIFFG